MRSLVALSLIILASACSASADRTEGSSADLNASAPNNLVADLKAAYEAHSNSSILGNVRGADFHALGGAARQAFDEYANTSNGGGIAEVGSPIAQVGTFEGQTIYFVAGDLSDTGSEYGFYDAQGNALAVAYTGQGEHPGPGGVDWEDTTKPTNDPPPPPTTIPPAPLPPDSPLIVDLKKAYEANQSDSILGDLKPVAAADLKGYARQSYDEYAETSKEEYGNNSAIAEVGTFEGQTVYYVAGILSDTGNEAGFYDANGNYLAVAYTGQGEHPGPGGVDWTQ